ncbi:hypothetical protein [Candidatus Colwellia aromaticivorans]|uniref:hypothetical protein n=1 Tax=Candidatus Colwellia aromaticivorans TaxID=2267621 RepID=UPI000DF4445E|nr:hypothetical protein [Candidatus Colwellia aromaticivorans]
MKWFLNNVPSQWRIAFAVVVTAIMMTVIYDYGWQIGLPLALRNLSGLILFSCIMLGAGAAYIGARVYGSNYAQAIKIALVTPVIWHIKEMIVCMGFYGFAAGLYSGIQGPYLFYYCIVFMLMGACHLLYQISLRLQKKSGDKIIKSTALFFIPMLVIGGLEGTVMLVFGFDLFVFQGFLTGYRAFIM